MNKNKNKTKTKRARNAKRGRKGKKSGKGNKQIALVKQGRPKWGVRNKNRDHNIRIKERPYDGKTMKISFPVAVVNSTYTYAQFLSIPINPGLTTFSDWSANAARGWEKWRFVGDLYFRYTSYTTDFASGNIGFAVDYDPNDDDSGLNWKQFLETGNAVEWKINQSGTFGLRRDEARKWRYVRRSDTPVSDAELKFFDLGQLIMFVNSTDVASNEALGTIRLHAQIEWKYKQVELEQTFCTLADIGTYAGYYNPFAEFEIEYQDTCPVEFSDSERLHFTDGGKYYSIEVDFNEDYGQWVSPTTVDAPAMGGTQPGVLTELYSTVDAIAGTGRASWLLHTFDIVSPALPLILQWTGLNIGTEAFKGVMKVIELGWSAYTNYLALYSPAELRKQYQSTVNRKNRRKLTEKMEKAVSLLRANERLLRAKGISRTKKPRIKATRPLKKGEKLKLIEGKLYTDDESTVLMSKEPLVTIDGKVYALMTTETEKGNSLLYKRT